MSWDVFSDSRRRKIPCNVLELTSRARLVALPAKVRSAKSIWTVTPLTSRFDLLNPELPCE